MRKLILICTLFLVINIVQAQSEIRTLAFCNLTIIRDSSRQNADEQNLFIQDTTGNVVVAYSVTSLPRFNPSPDCRFLAAYLRFEYGEDQILYVWDAQTGQELHTTRYSLFQWSPDSNRLFIENRSGAYLWDFVTDTVITLSTENINRYRPRLLWSPNRGLLYFSLGQRSRATQTNDETVRAYNWLTGEVVAEYTNLAAEDVQTGVELSADERYLIVYSMHTYPEYQGITVYDVDTGTVWMLDSGTHEFINNNRQIEISPDGRYLVAANRHLWVWELPHLTDTTIEHTPIIFYGPEAWVTDFHFISPTVIEATDSSDFSSRWDVSNGDPIP